MSLTAIKAVIETLEDNEIDSDMQKSLEIMLNNDNFKIVHSAIKERLSKISKSSESEKKTLSFNVPGTFYKTNNGSLVVMRVKHEGNIPDKNVIEVIVVSGGFKPDLKDKKLQSLSTPFNAKITVYGSVIFSGYTIDENGKYHGKESDETFPMHIKEQLNIVNENNSIILKSV